ncbi:IS110 family transposase [Bradyrhizobium sp. CCBAU 11361]|uniref:IS110 family transposase n=1 Tax=Bradyrhizobium sp. CCBAU 11361 TaxID=1630812 RepID=UPI002FDFDC47
MYLAAVRVSRAPEPVRSLGTFTALNAGSSTAVMELTSVSWIPIFELLDARGFAVFLVHARDAKHVPGRKTDVSDARWLQRLHSFGRPAFGPKDRLPSCEPTASARASAGGRRLTHPA